MHERTLHNPTHSLDYPLSASAFEVGGHEGGAGGGGVGGVGDGMI